ncbi:hypothetical protein TNIN_176611 [Trichonephila inaurata madagascariensis]|uniref:Uncharacterized protein n=1 Tax=Trichonephila inaurata madagascariensis TaxID=2747483 RepID=A0A8X7C4K3_9ARAC|nr:hypothetical protein TNIN_176611 [Trichonephila inaurata madagascariensis]
MSLTPHPTLPRRLECRAQTHQVAASVSSAICPALRDGSAHKFHHPRNQQTRKTVVSVPACIALILVQDVGGHSADSDLDRFGIMQNVLEMLHQIDGRGLQNIQFCIDLRVLETAASVLSSLVSLVVTGCDSRQVSRHELLFSFLYFNVRSDWFGRCRQLAHCEKAYGDHILGND